MAKPSKTNESRVRTDLQKAKGTLPQIINAVNILWILTVVAFLWIGAVIIYRCTANVPNDVKTVITAGLFTLGLMYLVAHLNARASANIVK